MSFAAFFVSAEVVLPFFVEPRTFDWQEMIRYAWIGAAASAPLIVAGTIWLIILLAV
jgi:hypothetical protein